MANIPITGLSGLGASIANAGADMLGRQRQLEDENRRRANQLQDVQAARDYSDAVRLDERANRLEDQKQLDEQRGRQALIAALRTEGLLPPGAESDPAAISAAYAEFQKRGLEEMYRELGQTPGPDGRPLLTDADLSNPEKIAAAKDALGRIKAEQVKFSLGQRDNAQATVDNIQNQLGQVRARSAQVASRIDTPPRQFGPADQQVLALAAQMAEQAKPGSGRDRKAIAAMVPIAQKELNDNALISHAQNVQSATRELESLRYNEAQLTNALRETIQTFKVAPSAKAGAAVLEQPTAAPVPTASAAATPEQIAAAMDKVFGGTAPANRGSELLRDTGTTPSGPTPIPPRYQPEESASWRQTGGRVREAIGDAMRAGGQAVSNIVRPSSWHGDFDAAYYERTPEAQIAQLKARLGALRDQSSATATAIKNRLYELEQTIAKRDGDGAALLRSPTLPAVSTPLSSQPAPISPPTWWKTSQPVPAGL